MSYILSLLGIIKNKRKSNISKIIRSGFQYWNDYFSAIVNWRRIMEQSNLIEKLEIKQVLEMLMLQLVQ
jgi:hypothetical protein